MLIGAGTALLIDALSSARSSASRLRRCAVIDYSSETTGIPRKRGTLESSRSEIPYVALPFRSRADFIPVLRYLDDAIFIASSLRYAHRRGDGVGDREKLGIVVQRGEHLKDRADASVCGSSGSDPLSLEIRTERV